MLISAFGPLAVSWALALLPTGSIAPVNLKPEPEVAVSVKLVVPSRAVALDRAETASASAAPEDGPAATLGAGALAAGVALPLSHPATAIAAVAIVARPRP